MGGQSSQGSSKPLSLDPYMQNTLYPEDKAQQQYILSNYPSNQAFDTMMGQLSSSQQGLSSQLAGNQGDINANESLVSNLMTPEMFQQSMQPYLNSAYQGIGQSGMPDSSYADTSISDAITQGWFGNLGNIENVYGTIGNERTLAENTMQAQTSLAGTQYGAATEPLSWMEAIQSGRYGIPVQSNSSSGWSFSI